MNPLHSSSDSFKYSLLGLHFLHQWARQNIQLWPWPRRIATPRTPTDRPITWTSPFPGTDTPSHTIRRVDDIFQLHSPKIPSIPSPRTPAFFNSSLPTTEIPAQPSEIEIVGAVKEQVVVEGEKGAPPPLPPYVTVIKDLYKGALALIPFFIMALYTSKQELLQNVNVNIKAAHNPKVYQIGLGIQSNGEFSIAFEVIAGKKIRFLHHKDAEISTGQVKPVFIPENSFITSMVGPFKHLIWKREEPYTNCNIVVEDVGNPALQDGPQTTYIKISDYEGFYIIHIDPTATPDIGVVANHVVKPAASRWSSFKAVTVPVSDPISTKEEHRRQVIPLPFADHPSDKRDYFLSISQWISP